MRLTARIERLASAAAVEKPASDIGIVWSTSDMRVERQQARQGDHVAVDLYIDEPEIEGGSPAIVRTVERFTRDTRDLGFVYDDTGARIGRIVAARGGLLRWELTVSGSAGR